MNKKSLIICIWIVLAAVSLGYLAFDALKDRRENNAWKDVPMRDVPFSVVQKELKLIFIGLMIPLTYLTIRRQNN
jgi:hypothetical protein